MTWVSRRGDMFSGPVGDRATEISRFLDLYDSGTKLWTRELLSEVADQIDTAHAVAAAAPDGELEESDGVVVRIPDILGQNELAFPVRIQRSRGTRQHSDGDPDMEESFQAGIVCSYNGRYRLDYVEGTGRLPSIEPTAAMALHSLELYHVKRTRDKRTKELLPSWFQTSASAWNDSDGLLDAEEIKKRLAMVADDWKAEKEGALDRTGIAPLLVDKNMPRVSKIVGFGMGSIADPATGRQSALEQHALILGLRAVLEAHSDESGNGGQHAPTVRILLQDPGYTPSDEQALRDFGFEVVRDPRGFVEVDDETLVFEYGCSAPVVEVLAEWASPAGILGGAVLSRDMGLGAMTPRIARWLGEGWDERNVNLPWASCGHALYRRKSVEVAETRKGNGGEVA